MVLGSLGRETTRLHPEKTLGEVLTFNDFQVSRHHSGTISLVATTADSSAAGVELPTDDYRQLAGITDENSFIFIFLCREPIFCGIFFLTKQNGTFYAKNGAFLHLLLVCTIFFVYVVCTLFVRVPVPVQ